MTIEINDSNNVTITVSSTVDSFGLRRIIYYVKYLEATAKTRAKQTEIDRLSDSVNANWWLKNRKQIIT
jgi:hypothetical protein